METVTREFLALVVVKFDMRQANPCLEEESWRESRRSSGTQCL